MPSSTEFQANFAASAAEAAEAAPEPEFVEAGGRRLRYLELGDAGGTPILFIHGFGGDLNNWLFNQPPLSESHTTYAIDLPGHGGSTKEVGTGDVGALTAAVCDFMAAKDIAQAPIWSAIRWAGRSASTWRSTIPSAWPRSRRWHRRRSGPRSRWSTSTAS